MPSVSVEQIAQGYNPQECGEVTASAGSGLGLRGGCR